MTDAYGRPLETEADRIAAALEPCEDQWTRQLVQVMDDHPQRPEHCLICNPALAG